MSVKQYDIEIPKKDYLIIELAIKDKGEIAKLAENDLLFMTVKRFPEDEECIFQKILGKGISYNEQTKKYEIEITSEDTKDMVQGKKVWL